jgi:hypothetical protein
LKLYFRTSDYLCLLLWLHEGIVAHFFVRHEMKASYLNKGITEVEITAMFPF